MVSTPPYPFKMSLGSLKARINRGLYRPVLGRAAEVRSIRRWRAKFQITLLCAPTDEPCRLSTTAISVPVPLHFVTLWLAPRKRGHEVSEACDRGSAKSKWR